MQRRRFLLLVAGLLLALMPLRLCADEPLGWRNPDAIMSFKTKGRFIRVPVTIGGKTYLFALGTGSSITAVDESLRPLLGLEMGRKVARDGFGEIRWAIHLRPEIRTGDAKIIDIAAPRGGLIAAANLSALRKLDPEIFGILGQDLMCKWVLMVSFDERLPVRISSLNS